MTLNKRAARKGRENRLRDSKGRLAAFEPTSDQRMLVSACKAAGMTDRQIARLLDYPHGVALNTLKRHFRTELRSGADVINAKVVGNLARLATDPTVPAAAQVTAAIWWTKNKLGWRSGDSRAGSQGDGADNSPSAVPAGPLEVTFNIGKPIGGPDVRQPHRVEYHADGDVRARADEYDGVPSASEG